MRPTSIGLKLSVHSYEDIVRIAEINGVKSVDFFQEYSLPKEDFSSTELQALLDCEYAESDISIGIIDGGISEENEYLQPYIIAQEKYVYEEYRNPHHATFIASTIQYGNLLNNISSTTCHRFKFVDVIAIPNSDEEYGPTDTISEYDLMEIIEEVMDKYSDTTKIWNLSLGIESKRCSGAMSDLGIFLDYIQDKYQVQIFVSSGNVNDLPLRTWPPQIELGEHEGYVYGVQNNNNNINININIEEIDIIVRNIMQNLSEVPPMDAETIADAVEMVREEIKKEESNKKILSNGIKLIAPMISIVNGIPVLAENLGKFVEYISAMIK